MKQYTIYTLSDPRDGRVRYVGCTSKTLNERLRAHVYGARTYRDKCAKSEWVRGLLAEGMCPEPHEIERVHEDQWEDAERHWIAWYREIGSDLTNSCDGGSGTPGFKHTEEQKSAIGLASTRNQTGKKRTAATCAAMSAGQLKIDPDTRARMSAATSEYMRNRPPELLAKLREMNIGRKATAEARANMSAAHQNVSEETRQKLRQAVLERPEEQRRAFAQSSKGRKRSAETRERMSLAAKARWERERAAKEQDRGS